MPCRRWLAMAFVMYFAVFTCLYQACTLSVQAEEISADEEIRELLNKGLTIYEIDQELDRLTAKEEELTVEIQDVTQRISEQEVIVAAKREQAGKVLRTYYTGNRQHLWLLILKADNFYDALRTYYYLSMIYKYERKILQEHAEVYQELKRLLARLEEDRQELRRVKAEYLAQRERLIALQEQLDQELAARDDADAIKQQIEALTKVWEEEGLPIFRHYFRELAAIITKLPEELIRGNKISLKSGRFVLSITDDELTEFFRRHNPEDFENFTFSFANDDFTAYGAKDNTAISISGYYEVQEEDNIILFHLTSLIYNSFELPDTTIRDLSEQFDLNFYPDYLDMPFKIQAKEVVIEDGTLSISFVLRR